MKKVFWWKGLFVKTVFWSLLSILSLLSSPPVSNNFRPYWSAALLQSSTSCNYFPAQNAEDKNSRNWPRFLVVKGEPAQINMKQDGLNLNCHGYNPKCHTSTSLFRYSSWQSIPASHFIPPAMPWTPSLWGRAALHLRLDYGSNTLTAQKTDAKFVIQRP